MLIGTNDVDVSEDISYALRTRGWVSAATSQAASSTSKCPQTSCGSRRPAEMVEWLPVLWDEWELMGGRPHMQDIAPGAECEAGAGAGRIPGHCRGRHPRLRHHRHQHGGCDPSPPPLYALIPSVCIAVATCPVMVATCPLMLPATVEAHGVRCGPEFIERPGACYCS